MLRGLQEVPPGRFQNRIAARGEILNLPAKVARPQGRAELRIAASDTTQQRILDILDVLPEPV